MKIRQCTNPACRALSWIAAGRCITLNTTEWAGSKSKLIFQTASGDQFETTADDFLRGRYTTRGTYAVFNDVTNLMFKMRRFASQNGGRLVSKHYEGTKALYRFELSTGEIFETSYFALKYRGWPSDISDLSRLLRSDHSHKWLKIRDIVEAVGGRMITSAWLGNNMPITWLSGSGRELTSTPHIISTAGLECLCEAIDKHIQEQKLHEHK